MDSKKKGVLPGCATGNTPNTTTKTYLHSITSETMEQPAPVLQSEKPAACFNAGNGEPVTGGRDSLNVQSPASAAIGNKPARATTFSITFEVECHPASLAFLEHALCRHDAGFYLRYLIAIALENAVKRVAGIQAVNFRVTGGKVSR